MMFGVAWTAAQRHTGAKLRRVAMSRRLLLIALFVSTLSLAGCTDTCPFARDGVCDEDGPFPACSAGTDSTDCRGGTSGCSDTCEFAGDGECDDGGVNATTSVCDFGTDCSDCGGR
jgi:hypothetical protein